MSAFLRRVVLAVCFTSLIFANHTLAAKNSTTPIFRRFSGHRMIVSKGTKFFKGFYFLFVDNTSSLTTKHGRRTSSDGSFLHPYRTLAEAEANSETNDIIYVFPGDGTTNGMDSGIILQASQKLWGAGTSHVLQTSGGSVTIPAGASSAPKITNPFGDGVTLATDNEVSGIILPGVFGNAIVGSVVSGSVTLESLVITDSSSDGIFIDSVAPSNSMAFTVSNCVIQASAVFSIEASFSNAVSVQMLNNTMESNINGSIFTFVDAGSLSVSGNAFRNGTSISEAPFEVIAGTNSLTAMITSNSINGNTTGALRFILNDAPSLLSLTDNTLTNNGTGAEASLGSAIVIFPNGTSGNCNLILSNNTISGNAGDALFSFNGGGNFNDFQVTASDNRVVGNGGGGYVFATTCNTFTLMATNNIISGGGDHGITTAAGTLNTATITLVNNQITQNSNFASAISLSHSGSNLTLVARDNDLSGNDTSGIIMFSSDEITTVTASIENNTITNNQNLESNSAGGIDLEQFTGMCLDLSDNILSNNANSDLFIGSTDPSPSVCMEMNGNSSTAGYLLSNGTGVFNLAPTNAVSVNVGTITTIGTIAAIDTCPCSP